MRKRIAVYILFALLIISALIILPIVEPYVKNYVAAVFNKVDENIQKVNPNDNSNVNAQTKNSQTKKGQSNTKTAEETSMGVVAVDLIDTLFKVLRIILWMSLIISTIRFINSIVFSRTFRATSQEINSLLRNVVTIVVVLVAFVIILQSQFSSAYEKLAPIFTGSTIIGIVIGLALQDTLGNLFAGIAIQADKPFQVGDVIQVQNKGIGVVENITWRGVKIRTFQNKLLDISNSVLGKEAIEVAPKDNLNARLVFFNTLYSNSPSKTIRSVREAVRQCENVSRKIRPIVRVRNLGDNGIDWEVKYWLDDYSKHNETDALIRQRIWYVFQRENIHFAYPTRTLYIEKEHAPTIFEETTNDIIERLSEVLIFAPLSGEETRQLANASTIRVFAPGEAIVRQGETGKSMFIIHRGTVDVRLKNESEIINLGTLSEGDFFGEMGLFTGEPRSATVTATDETEVLQINDHNLKPILEENPNLVRGFSQLIDERRSMLAERNIKTQPEKQHDKAGVFYSIKNFFGLKK